MGDKLKILSDLMQRMQFAIRAGMQFGGKRDLYTVFGYKTKLDARDLITKYMRQDIASRVVDAPPDAIWGDPPTIIPEKNSKAFTNKWDALVRKHSIWSVLNRLDKLSSLGRYSALLVGVSDSGAMDVPISSGDNELLYLTPLSELSCIIREYEDNPKNPRYGLPKYYNVQRSDPSVQPLEGQAPATGLKDLKVHYSRIIHVAQNTLEDNIIGTPILVRVFNLLEDMLKVVGGTAETYWLTANRGIQADIDKEMDLDPQDAKDLEDEIEEYQHQLRRIIRTRGVELNVLKSESPDPAGTFEMLVALLSGTSKIPQRILIGSEAGQLASQQDRANWADHLQDRRSTFVEPVIIIPVINTFVLAGILPDPGAFKVKWPEAFRMSPLERAQTMAQKARAVSNLSKQFDGKVSPMISPEEAREIISLEGPVPKMKLEVPQLTQEGQALIPESSAAPDGGDSRIPGEEEEVGEEDTPGTNKDRE